jgi:hypothetical protein
LHSNIDRQLAIWQALNPDKWFDGRLETDPKPTDPLLPFHYDQEGDLYDSDKARRWWDLGYQYEILEGVIDKNGDVDRNALTPLKIKLAATYGRLRRLMRTIPDIDGKENDYILNVIYDRYDPNYSALKMRLTWRFHKVMPSTVARTPFTSSSVLPPLTSRSGLNSTSTRPTSVLSILSALRLPTRVTLPSRIVSIAQSKRKQAC